ncbi:MAG TPA: quinoprotein dehydrogenase-associated SoxYZ-like carrier, partial [Methyloceanibacter sp.]|nr:quinoprotein dehydrogenase-associated SoxYZ-like carrier [Methyloceanibacter sp.]
MRASTQEIGAMTSLAKTLPIGAAAALAVCLTVPAQAGTDIWPTLRQQAFGDRPIQAEDGAVVLELPATADDAALVPLTVRVP